jgi:hypothetical protein
VIEIGNHLQLLRRRHAPESFDLDGVELLVHAVDYPTSGIAGLDGSGEGGFLG